MAQPARARMLKLSLPGVDPAAIPMLTAEQVTQIPAEFLDFLHDHGQVEDYGDLKMISVKDDRHNFTILSIAAWVTNGRLEPGELEGERLDPMDLRSAQKPVIYNRNTHEQDATFVASKETHARFLQRLGLYTISIRAGMQDMQAYLSNTIRTEYPVYEAELVALLTAVLEYTNDLSHLDPALASFVGQRMFCLRDLLAKTGAVLPLLCKTISAKDRFLALAGRADPADLALALAELRNSVGQVGETYALLDTFIKQNNVDEDKIQQVPAVTPAQTAAQKTRAKRKRGFTSKARVASETTEVVPQLRQTKWSGTEVLSHPMLPTVVAAPLRFRRYQTLRGHDALIQTFRYMSLVPH